MRLGSEFFEEERERVHRVLEADMHSEISPSARVTIGAPASFRCLQRVATVARQPLCPVVGGGCRFDILEIASEAVAAVRRR
jgi:hypothetical protein